MSESRLDKDLLKRMTEVENERELLQRMTVRTVVVKRNLGERRKRERSRTMGGVEEQKGSAGLRPTGASELEGDLCAGARALP